ncbi:MAG: CDP-glucose 4,6-dehydratase [Proteobacteria bacterium]|nr:CDP-glucose 4,6-dehydratase [Pseudomonadota bacterium]NOG59092.1 CDP-glucose 4,6-dehydratase [Pseudomonadota bacterium]
MGEVVKNKLLTAFAGRRVLITGHTGFKGSWLSFMLHEAGADVLGYALPPDKDRNHFSLLGLSDRIHHLEADIRNAEKLKSCMKEFQPEFVFHLAAQALVRPSYQDPKTTFDTNIMGAVNLLEAVRFCESVRSLVFITSDKCYENNNWVWGYRENDRLGGHDPYSASKAAAEIVFSAYARSFFSDRKEELGVASARAGNVIGGGDWSEDRIIPDCIRAIEKGIPIQIRSPNATRPWQHVLEPLSGYLQLALGLRDEPLSYLGAWNFGPSSSEVCTVFEVAKHIVANMGCGTIHINESDNNQHEAKLLQLNCDKARQILGWSPRWDIEKTLTFTAEWYKEVNSGSDASDVTRKQIADYFG